jgi:hypothetical protein
MPLYHRDNNVGALKIEGKPKAKSESSNESSYNDSIGEEQKKKKKKKKKMATKSKRWLHGYNLKNKSAW